MFLLKKAKSIDEIMVDIKRAQEVHCPYCDLIIDEAEIISCVISYHGYPDEGIKELECPECIEKFYVKEIVNRIYEVSKTEEEATGEKEE